MTADAQIASPLELRLEPGSEGVIRLVVVAPIELSLSLGQVEQQGRQYKLQLRGTQKNLPQDATCRVLIKASSLGEERDSELGALPMQIHGNNCTVEVEIDTFASGFFGKGSAQLTVIPDFPFATGCVVSNPLKFDNPLDVEGVGSGQGKNPGPRVLLGQEFELEPVFSEKFKDSTLRLSVFHAGAIAADRLSDSLAYSIFEWTADDKTTKRWRVGCAESDGTSLLTYLDTNKDEYSFDLRLEVVQETDGQEVSYLIWDRPHAISFPKPTLTSFELGFGSVFVKVADVAPGFELPLELTLWQYGLHDLDPIVQTVVMSPLSRPTEAEAASPEYFRQLLLPSVLVDRKENIFALLRIPRTLSGTDTYVPVSAVMKYDESKFLTFDDDQLWLDPPRKKRQGTPRSKQKKTPKDLATAIASQELQAQKVHPTRTPHFGTISTGVRDANLLVSIKLVGDADYWQAAGPAFSLHDESGQTELVKLATKPSDQNPRLHEALLPLDDKRILGQKVRIRGQVTRPDAQLWEELVAAPPALSVPYECVPLLSEPRMHVVELTDATKYIQLRCQTRHVPNGKNGATLGFRLYERFSDMAEPILLTQVKFRYDVAKGTGGQCDSRGQLVARITDQDMLQKLLNEGRYKLEACVLDKEGKVLSTEVRSTSSEFGTSPRKLQGTMIWGGKVPVEFRKKVMAICDLLKINVDHLMACMAFETERTFSPGKQNNGGHQAYGLIQFTPEGSVGLGKTVDELKTMTQLEQLDYVSKYMSRCIAEKGRLETLSDVYMAIICPAAVRQPEDYVCYSEAASPAQFKANQPLARGKAYITKADATAPVKQHLEDGETFRA